MPATISINTAKSAWNNALNVWQDWSDATFDDKYRAATLTLVEGLATLIGYLFVFTYRWLPLQCVRTARYWLEEVVQAVPVLNGWWVAPSIKVAATKYPDICWQAIAPTVTADILDYELSFATSAELLT